MDFFWKTAFADTNSSSADDLILKINQAILNPLIGLMAAIAVVVFLYGVLEFIMGSDNQQKRDSGKKHIIWGVIGLSIMFAVMGIIELIKKVLGV